MEKKDLDIETIKRYWVTEAEEGLNVAGHLFEKGDYSYALFFGHLAIEKLLKGLYVERKHKHAPRIHNLLSTEFHKHGVISTEGRDLGSTRRFQDFSLCSK